MSIEISYDKSPGVEKWVVNKKSGSVKITDQSMHESRSEAIESAEKMANPGEEIRLLTDDEEFILRANDDE